MKRLSGVLFSTAFAISAHAIVPNGSITAEFKVNYENRSLEPNDVAIMDKVELSGGLWDSSNEVLMIDEDNELTISAPEFRNIFTVRIYSDKYYPNVWNPISIVAVKGEGIEFVDDLNIDLTVEPVDGTHVTEQDYKVARFFFPDVRLSEITFRSEGTNYVTAVEVGLDSEPGFESEGPINVYANEVVPFVKRTNVYPYRYYISPDIENIVEDPDDLAMVNVPKNGISMRGKRPGRYIVYIDGDGWHMSECMKHIEVNYSTEPRPEESIIEVSAEKTAEFYDLCGRKTSREAKGFKVCKSEGSTAAKVVICR